MFCLFLVGMPAKLQDGRILNNKSPKKDLTQYVNENGLRGKVSLSGAGRTLEAIYNDIKEHEEKKQPQPVPQEEKKNKEPEPVPVPEPEQPEPDSDASGPDSQSSSDSSSDSDNDPDVSLGELEIRARHGGFLVCFRAACVIAFEAENKKHQQKKQEKENKEMKEKKGNCLWCHDTYTHGEGSPRRRTNYSCGHYICSHCFTNHASCPICQHSHFMTGLFVTLGQYENRFII